MRYVANGFSTNMLEYVAQAVHFTPYAREDAQEWARRAPFTSIVGHADTASLVSADLGVSVPVERATVTLRPGDEALIAQYVGPRLPEGTTALPEGAILRYMLVYLPLYHMSTEGEYRIYEETRL